MALEAPAPIICPAPILVGADARLPPSPLPRLMPAVITPAAPVRRVLYWVRQCVGNGVCRLVPVYGE